MFFQGSHQILFLIFLDLMLFRQGNSFMDKQLNGHAINSIFEYYLVCFLWNVNMYISIFFHYICDIQDATKQLTVLNDRSQGGASLTDGSLELMVSHLIITCCLDQQNN